MITDGLNARALQLMGFGVTLRPGYVYEKSAHEQLNEKNKQRLEKNRKAFKKKDHDAMAKELLKRLPTTFTVADMGIANKQEPRIFPQDYLGGLVRYFLPYVDKQVISRTYIYTKKAEA